MTYSYLPADTFAVPEPNAGCVTDAANRRIGEALEALEVARRDADEWKRIALAMQERMVNCSDNDKEPEANPHPVISAIARATRHAEFRTPPEYLMEPMK